VIHGKSVGLTIFKPFFGKVLIEGIGGRTSEFHKPLEWTTFIRRGIQITKLVTYALLAGMRENALRLAA
jgi:hypothetical protein